MVESLKLSVLPKPSDVDNLAKWATELKNMGISTRPIVVEIHLEEIEAYLQGLRDDLCTIEINTEIMNAFDKIKDSEDMTKKRFRDLGGIRRGVGKVNVEDTDEVTTLTYDIDKK